MNSRTFSTTYFDVEGRNAMRECIVRSFEWCAADGIQDVVIFTGTGEGPHIAAKELLSLDKYRTIRVTAVTPPVGRAYRAIPGDPASPLVRAGINPAMREELGALGVTVVSAHLPFKEIHSGQARTSEWTRVAEAYGVLGGGFALCIQAIMVACDAGAIESGARIVAMSADTSFVATASRTDSFLSPFDGLLVEHIICRPARYQISKRDHLGQRPTDVQPTPPPPAPSPPMLNAGPSDQATDTKKIAGGRKKTTSAKSARNSKKKVRA